MALSDEDLNRIAEKLKEHKVAGTGSHKVYDEHSDFYLAPEDHYNAHKNLTEMYHDWKALKDTFMKMMLGFVLVGAAVMAGVGMVVEFAKDIPAKLLGH